MVQAPSSKQAGQQTGTQSETQIASPLNVLIDDIQHYEAIVSTLRMLS
jgi:hypothetical protein